MLVLSRNPGESVVIGEDIIVTILAVRGNQVRIGFTAPLEMPIRRKEIELEDRNGAPALAHA